METCITVVKLLGGIAIFSVQVYESKKILSEVEPNQIEESRRKNAKTDPNVKWDRLDELSYSVRTLLICVNAWIRIIVIILWSIFCRLI